MTLIEVVLVFAILVTIAGVLLPSVGPRLESARQTRAKADVEELAQALRAFWRGTGVWPTRDASSNADGLRVLFSGPRLPSSNPWASSATWWSTVGSGSADVFDNHLGRNRPGGSSAAAYPSSGKDAWRGPYLSACALDPWGRPYVALVAAGHASVGVSTPVQLFVLSAGPDGQIDTSSAGLSTDGIAGDDIGLIAWRRT